MAVVGMWVAIVGYGIAYAGFVKLGGGQCGIIAAFQGKCTPANVSTKAQTTGATNATKLLNQQSQQQSMIGSQPIAQQPQVSLL